MHRSQALVLRGIPLGSQEGAVPTRRSDAPGHPGDCCEGPGPAEVGDGHPSVHSPFGAGSNHLVPADGHSALVTFQKPGNPADVRSRRPNYTPPYYLGRPASVWINVMKPGRRRTAASQLACELARPSSDNLIRAKGSTRSGRI
jgi:hypothetical protein